jgi:NAD(P)-dependent dehydrogenase (short-subunit alcohol dehydrogenase family)
MSDVLMQSKTVIVTGANRGLGREMTRQLAGMGARVIMACRSIQHADQVKSEMISEMPQADLRVMPLDLADQQSIKTFADSFMKEYQRLDVLLNNAGVQTPNHQLTPGGVELTFAINVLGPHILTQLLLPALQAAPSARIVNVASDYAGGLDIDDLNFKQRKYDAIASYKQSKQANRMMTRAWARLLQDDRITVNSMTPDLVAATDLFRHQPAPVKLLLRFIGLFGGASIKQGADTAVWLASSPGLEGSSGGYYRKRRKMPCRFEDEQAEKQLWEICQEMIAVH